MEASERQPPRISVALNAFGGASIVVSVLFLGGSFYMESDLAKAFCLGAFFSGILGSILLFGFAKVIDLLDAIREQAASRSTDEGSDPFDPPPPGRSDTRAAGPGAEERE